MADYFISTDWGTSSLRLKLVDRNTGDELGAVTSDQGIKRTYFDWENNGGDRMKFYLEYLSSAIDRLQQKTHHDCSMIPIVLSGMASSSIGMLELPYATIPFDFDNDALISDHISLDSGQSLWLISGIATAKDVMRGEEVQVLGWHVNREVAKDCVLVLPGTHSKHISMKGSTMTDFKTYMTGEIFEMICQHSILKNDLISAPLDDHWEAFRQGVHDVQREALTHLLFSIRGRTLQGSLLQEETRAYLSGILIGSEFKSGFSEKVVLCAEAKFIDMYQRALEVLDISDIDLVEDVDKLVVEGQRAFLKSKVG